MKCLDSSFLVDYLDGEEATLVYLSENAEAPLYVPAIALYEIYEGAVHDDDDEPKATRQNLDWMDDVLPFSETTALETARLQRSLLEAGSPLAPRDAMVAATAREVGATLVSGDGDFLDDSVREVLDVETY
jgi:predicted nucleic acid-binding protein